MKRMIAYRVLIVLLAFLSPVTHLLAQPQYLITTQNEAQESGTNCDLAKPFIITVRNRYGRPLPGILVESVCLNSDSKAKLHTPVVRTDENGQAKIRFHTGTKNKLYKIRSSVYPPRDHTPIKTIVFKSMAINGTTIFFFVLGGLALFLFGMKLLSDGLQTSAGERMQSILSFLSSNKYMGVLVGFLVTAVLQSSSVTTVMLIGFVNAGIMSFLQSIGIVMGANIGTTITGFIISLKGSAIAYPILIFGFLLYFLGKRNRIRYIGQVFLGLGLVFIGLMTMAAEVKPLKDSPTISAFFIQFSEDPLLAVFAGMAVTFAIQSSSATLGLIITLAKVGLVGIPGAVGLVLGSNIGTTITAQLAAIGANTNAKRVAMVHSIFNLIGVGMMLILFSTGWIKHFYNFTASIINLFSGKGLSLVQTGNHTTLPLAYMPIFVAFSHAIFNIGNTIILLPFSKGLYHLVIRLIPERTKTKFQYLEPHLLDTPALALSQTVSELSFMLSTAQKLFSTSTESLFTNTSKSLRKFERREDKVDSLQRDITEYLVQLTKRPMTEHESEMVPKLIHAVNDIERIGDLSENIMKTAVRCHDNKVRFTGDAKKEIRKMSQTVEQMTELTKKVLKEMDPEKTAEVFFLEKKVNRLQQKFRSNHIKRLKNGRSRVYDGILFLEIISTLERIADHLTNVSQAVQYSLQS